LTGLQFADKGYAKYYYNSINIARVNPKTGTNALDAYMSAYDNGSLGMKFDVPVLMMETFTPDRSAEVPGSLQVTAAVGQAKTLEQYLTTHQAGTPQSTSGLMGYNYFEYNDEPSHGGKATGLFKYGDSAAATVHTGTTAVFFGGYADITYPWYSPLTPVQNDNGTLADQLKAIFVQGP
jgi:hypothetical protein